MQCSRCHSGGFKERRVTKRPRLYSDKSCQPANWTAPSQLEWNTPVPLIENNERNPFSRFLATYQWPLLVCLITGLFCTASLFYLAASTLYLGIAAIPFLGLFVTGLFISIGLPFKLYKENSILGSSQ